MSVEAGTVLGFIGPNGAGKTTAMRMIAGAMPPSSGQISICGLSMEDDPLGAKAFLGYLPENAPLYQHTKVRHFLEFCAKMRGVHSSNLEKAVKIAAARCALEAVMEEETDSLSKGFRRRVCLAQAIIHDPKALLLDEPTDGLDPIQKIQIRSLIKELRQGRAIIVSTHILEELDAVCDRVMAIASGKLIFNGTLHEFKAAGSGFALEMALSGKTLKELSQTFDKTLSVKSVELVSSEGNACVVRLRVADACEETSCIDAIDAARAAGWHVDSCHQVSGGLDVVFASLIGRAAK